MQLKWDDINPNQFQFLLDNWSDMSLEQYQEFVEDRVELYTRRYEHGLDLWSGKCLCCELSHDNNEDCKEIALSKTRM